MSSTKTLRFLDIPEVVLFECLFPKLNTNTLLRLRLLCKAVKTYSDKFLSTKRPSKRKIHIFFDDEVDYEQGAIRLSDFLNQDAASSLPMPSSFLCLEYEPDQQNPRDHWNNQLGKPSFADLLLKYGRQIKSLKVRCLILPMVPGNPEFLFYEGLPNLECLDVETIFIYDIKEDASLKAENLPKCFQTQLRTLETELIRSENENAATEEHFWKFIDLCKELKSFRCPSAVGTFLSKIEDNNATEKLSVFQSLNRLLLSESPKLETLDLSYVDLNQQHGRPDWEGMIKFGKNCASLGTSLINVPADFLSEFELGQLNAIAGNVQSIINFSCSEDLKGVVFRNLYTLKVCSFTKPEQRITFDIIKRRLSISIFPNLKILKITHIKSGDSKFWSQLWPRLSQLQELRFELEESGLCDLEDETFFGRRANSPAFLGLRNLKNLSLVASPESKYLNISTLVFFGVIRFMRLQELHIFGHLGSVNKYGILALASPGPFKESIQLFPFRNWSFARGSQEEFREIAKLFPTNEPY